MLQNEENGLEIWTKIDEEIEQTSKDRKRMIGRKFDQGWNHLQQTPLRMKVLFCKNFVI